MQQSNVFMLSRPHVGIVHQRSRVCAFPTKWAWFWDLSGFLQGTVLVLAIHIMPILFLLPR